MSKLCPNGHETAINVVLPPRRGRYYCPECGWTDDVEGKQKGLPGSNPDTGERFVGLKDPEQPEG